VALAKRLFAAIEAGDLDGVRDCYTPDVVIWHNTDEVEQPLELNLRVLRWMVRTLPERRYDEQRLSATDTGFVSQHVLRGTTVDGRTVAIPACIVATCTDGRVSRIEEYIDSAHVARFTGGTEQREAPRRAP
jgi:ketosteroid isomerase-like protein